MKLILIILLLLPAIGSHAVSLTGQVVNEQGQVLTDVSLVTNVDRLGSHSDSTGHYELRLTTAVERVTFSAVGYHSRQFAITAVPDVVVLTRRYYPGENIVVTAGRAEFGVTPISFDNFSGDEIERDFTVSDIPLLLNTTPNLYSFSDGGGSLGYTYTQIRGFDDKRIATYVNGVPLNDPEDQYSYWVDLPDFTASVTDIQIQRGVGNSLYGDASFGGSINVVSKTLELPRQAKLTTGYGEYFAGGSSVGKTTKQSVEYASGLIDGRWAFSGRFSKQKSDGYREQSWVDSWAYYLTLARLDPNMTTELQVFGGPTSLHLTYLGVSRDQLADNRRYNPQTYQNEVDNFSQPHYHLHNSYRLSDRVTLDNTVYFIKGDGHYEQFVDGAAYADYNIMTNDTASLVRQQWVDKWQLGWNPRVDVSHSRGHHSFGGSLYYFESDHWGEVVWAQQAATALSARHRYYEYAGKKRVASVFGQEFYHLTPRLNTQATLQFRYQDYTFSQSDLGAFAGYQYQVDWVFLSPRLGLNYRLIANPGRSEANLFTNVGIASRTPTDADLYDPSDPNAFPSLAIVDTTSDGAIVFGDPNFESERVVNVEFGGNYRTPRWVVSANLYWMDFSNEIIRYGGINPSTGLQSTVNADGSYRAGIELSARYQPLEELTLDGNFSFNRYRIKDFTDTLDVYDASWSVVDQEVVEFSDVDGLGFPNFLGNLVVDYRPGSARLTYRLQAVGKQYMELLNLDSLAIDPYLVSSVSASYTFDSFMDAGALTVSIQVDNLFNKKYETSGYGWNTAFENPGGDPTLTGAAEYYVAAERSFWSQISLRLF